VRIRRALALNEHRFRIANRRYQPICWHGNSANNGAPIRTVEGVFDAVTDSEIDVVGSGALVDMAGLGWVKLSDVLRPPSGALNTSRRARAVSVGPMPKHRSKSNRRRQPEQSSRFDVRIAGCEEIGVETDDHPAIRLHMVDTGGWAKPDEVVQGHRDDGELLPQNAIRVARHDLAVNGQSERMLHAASGVSWTALVAGQDRLVALDPGGDVWAARSSQKLRIFARAKMQYSGNPHCARKGQESNNYCYSSQKSDPVQSSFEDKIKE
jgi:hypothetical protein